VITPRTKLLSTLKKKTLARYNKNTKYAIKEKTYNATSDALKNLSRERDRRKRNLIKVESQKLIYKRSSMILSTLGHTPTKVKEKTVTATATSWQHTHQRHSL
jgi:hypothetical protein